GGTGTDPFCEAEHHLCRHADRVSPGRDCGFVLLQLERAGRLAGAVGAGAERRHWHELPPATDASRLLDAEVGRVRDGAVRHAGAAGGTDLLGRGPPDASPADGSAGGSALAARRRLVVAHGLDSAWIAAQPESAAGALCARSGERPILYLAEP